MIMPVRRARIERAITSDHASISALVYPTTIGLPLVPEAWTRTSFARDREHVEQVVVAQIGLHRERKLGKIGELLKRRMHAGRVESFL